MSGIREGASHSHSQNEISQPRSGELGPTRLCGLTTFSTVCVYVCVCRQLSTYFLPVGSKPLGHCEIKGLEKFLRNRLVFCISSPALRDERGRVGSIAGRRRRSGHWMVLGSRGGSTFTMFASNDTQAAKRPK